MKIWFKHENGKPEVVDEVSSREANGMLYEYMIAFGCLPGQHRYGKDKLWVGRKKDEPKN